MEYASPCFAFVLGLPLEFLGFFVLPFLFKDPAAKGDGANDNCISTTYHSSPTGNAISIKFKGKIKKNLIGGIRYIRRDIGSLLGQRTLLIGLLALVVHKVARPMMELLLQYMSVRFEWPLSRVCSFGEIVGELPERTLTN
jgi:hypothetical protein